MRVILNESIEHLGEVGDVVNVRDGYARNYLLPRGKALVATEQGMKQLALRKKKLAEQREKALTDAKKLAEKIAGMSVTVQVRVGEGGQLYGSVGASEIVNALEEKDVSVEKRQVLLSEPIRELGMHEVTIRFHHDVIETLKVLVVKEASAE